MVFFQTIQSPSLKSSLDPEDLRALPGQRLAFWAGKEGCGAGRGAESRLVDGVCTRKNGDARVILRGVNKGAVDQRGFIIFDAGIKIDRDDGGRVLKRIF